MRFGAAILSVAGVLLSVSPAPGQSAFSETRLVASDAGPEHLYGPIDASGDTLVVGAQRFNSPLPGVAYVYDRNLGGPDRWGERQILSPSAPHQAVLFGESVAIDGDRIVVGDGRAEVLGAVWAGAAYVFDRGSDGTWSQGTRFTEPFPGSNRRFGTELDIQGNVAVVAANRGVPRVWVFEDDPGDAERWGRVTQLVPSVPIYSFGSGVSIDDDTIAIGGVATGGKAFVFERHRGGPDQWGEVAVINVPASGASDGPRVAVSGDLLVAGAFRDGEAGTNAGAVYIHERHRGGIDNWGLVARVTPDVLGAQTFFGRDVALDGDRLLVGAPLRGLAYAFARHLDGVDRWGQLAGFSGQDAFGEHVNVDGDRLVVGDPEDPHAGNFAGEAYLFRECSSKPEGLVAWWPLDHLIDGTTRDLVQERHGSVTGGFTVPGAVGGAVALAESGGGVEIPHDALLDFVASDFSIDMLLHTAAANGTRAIVTKAGSYAIELVDGLPRVDLPGFQRTASGPGLADGVFHHLALTVQRGTPTHVRLFVDGVNVFTEEAALGPPQGDAPLRLGPALDGTLDEVALFDRALSPAEVLDHAVSRDVRWCVEQCTLTAADACSTGTVTLRLCSGAADSNSYVWSAGGLPPEGPCDVFGPAEVVPAMGEVTLPVGSACATVDFAVDCAALSAGHAACVSATARSAESDAALYCEASITLPAPPAAGAVQGLRVDQQSDLLLDWGESCADGDSDYSVYQGTLGAFTTHRPRSCTTNGSTDLGLVAPEDDAYFIIVPHNGATEGAYGTASDLIPRPRSDAPCRPQEVATCAAPSHAF